MKLFVKRDSSNNTLYEVRKLVENENVVYEIIDDPPVIEKREGYIGQYTLNSDGEIVVEYIELEPTETEKLQTRISELEEVVMQLSMSTVAAE